MFLTFFIIAFSFLIAGTFVIGSLFQEKEEDIGQEAMLVSRTVANLPEIKTLLQRENFQDSSKKSMKLSVKYVISTKQITSSLWI